MDEGMAAAADGIKKMSIVTTPASATEPAKPASPATSSQQVKKEPIHEPMVRLSPSLFQGRGPVIFFEYPKELKLPPRKGASFPTPAAKLNMEYDVYWERNVIKNAFNAAGFKRNKGGRWRCYFGKHFDPENEYRNLTPLHKVNTIPGTGVMGRKDRLARRISERKRAYGAAYDFCPEPYLLPRDMKRFQKEFLPWMATEETAVASSFGGKKKAQKKAGGKAPAGSKAKNTFWIVKPFGAACGRGIQVFKTEEVIDFSKKEEEKKKKRQWLLQEYLRYPYTISGRKFDLRLYVLISSFDPLKLYLFEEGLARFCTHKYDCSKLGDQYAHLTNYSINKNNEDYVPANDDAQPQEGEDSSVGSTGKCTLKELWAYLRSKGEDVDKLLRRINDVIVKTVVAAESDISPLIHSLLRTREHKKCCYELLGFDLLMDRDLKPWLLEVNIYPSLKADADLDKLTKGRMVSDILHLVGVQPCSTKEMQSAPAASDRSANSASSKSLTKSSSTSSTSSTSSSSSNKVRVSGSGAGGSRSTGMGKKAKPTPGRGRDGGGNRAPGTDNREDMAAIVEKLAARVAELRVDGFDKTESSALQLKAEQQQEEEEQQQQQQQQQQQRIRGPAAAAVDGMKQTEGKQQERASAARKGRKGGKSERGGEERGELAANGSLVACSTEDLELIMDAEDEWARAATGGFQQLFPVPSAGPGSTVAGGSYLQFFPSIRRSDQILEMWASAYGRRDHKDALVMAALATSTSAVAESSMAVGGAVAAVKKQRQRRDRKPRPPPASTMGNLEDL
jgi:tubulin polyglutamylase TTLL4